jgi:hypothetical protein
MFVAIPLLILSAAVFAFIVGVIVAVPFGVTAGFDAGIVVGGALLSCMLLLPLQMTVDGTNDSFSPLIIQMVLNAVAAGLSWLLCWIGWNALAHVIAVLGIVAGVAICIVANFENFPGKSRLANIAIGLAILLGALWGFVAVYFFHRWGLLEMGRSVYVTTAILALIVGLHLRREWLARRT